MKMTSGLWLPWLVLLLFPLAASGFDNGPSWFGFSYTLNTSGARTIGMGSSGVASVNDASAVLVNPAALVRLPTSEFRLDSNFRHLDEVNLPGASNLGTGESIRLGLKVDETSQIDPALMAFATPTNNGRTVLALFYHEFLPYDRFVTVSNPLSGSVVEKHNVMFDLDEFGFSIAHSLHDGKLALGLSASLVTLNMDVLAVQLQGVEPFNEVEFASYGSQTEQEPIWRFALLYQPRDDLSLAFNYTLAPNPDYTHITANSPATVNSAAQNGCSGDINNAVLPDGTPTGSWICKSSLPLPSSVAIGVAYTPGSQWNLAFDLLLIDYSRITKELHASYAYPGGDVVVVQQKSDFEAEAVTEYHFGIEYLATIKHKPVALRAGYYFDPAHDIKYRGEDSTTNLIYTGGDDVHHLTAGMGMLLSDALQFDMALDLADDDSYRIALSFAYRL
ncbi:MAG TPA: hypothetical protein VIQ81_02240 [Gammaproteobacteria bacterium]